MIPLRIVMDGVSVITRDEAGRVRVSGALQGLDETAKSPSDEVQAAHNATLVVETILSRSLAAWGIEIEGDDDSKRVQVP